ncbi:dnaJ protein [Cinnamomum micranthum f. kanehirae]|uniref:DnaJ protein n=1 Tax=Cinnamomum micranthum f. kanehirae TaxID=337451 RepID=A0A443NUL8_9MAGN|nr:dnaJ protein [Cinnamomum micranthum f. kanehirae]
MRGQRNTSDNTRYYEILGVSKTASQNDLLSGFMTAVASYAPFPGRDLTKGDPEKRKIYDRYGEDAVKEGMSRGYGSHHMLRMYGLLLQSFNGGNAFGGRGSSRGQRHRRGEDVIHPLKVSLELLYNGTLKKLSFSRNVICSKCKDKGSKSSAPMACAGCQGSGMKVSICYLGQQMQQICNECKGTGETKGEKVVQEKKVFEVVVEKGMQNGQKKTFPGEADEAHETVAGDIVFVLQQKEHAKFKRNGDDLFVEHTVSLTEALCGFQFVLAHLDNRQLLIKSNPGEVLMPGKLISTPHSSHVFQFTCCLKLLTLPDDSLTGVLSDQFMAINDEGMPMYQRPFMRGKLYIHFTCKALETVLPPRTSVQLQDQLKDMMLGECEETTLYRDETSSAVVGGYDEDKNRHGGAYRFKLALPPKFHVTPRPETRPTLGYRFEPFETLGADVLGQQSPGPHFKFV